MTQSIMRARLELPHYSGRLLAKLGWHWGAISDVAFSRDGKMLASASYDGTIMLWNVARIVGP